MSGNNDLLSSPAFDKKVREIVRSVLTNNGICNFKVKNRIGPNFKNAINKELKVQQAKAQKGKVPLINNTDKIKKLSLEMNEFLKNFNLDNFAPGPPPEEEDEEEALEEEAPEEEAPEEEVAEEEAHEEEAHEEEVEEEVAEEEVAEEEVAEEEAPEEA